MQAIVSGDVAHIIGWCIILFPVMMGAWRGWRKGIWLSIFDLLGLVLAYAMVWFYTDEMRAWVDSQTMLSGLKLHWLSVTLLFVGTLVITAVFSRLIIHFSPLRYKSIASRVSGLGVGTLYGSMVMLITVWFILLLIEMQPMDTQLAYSNIHNETQLHNEINANYEIPPQNETTELVNTHQRMFPKDVVLLAKKLVNPVLTGWLSQSEDVQAPLVAVMVEQPQATLGAFRGLYKEPMFSVFMNDPYSQELMANSNLDGLMNEAIYRNLSASEGADQLKTFFEEQALGDDGNAVLAQTMITFYHKIGYLQADPKFQQLQQDPELQSLLKEGDLWALLNNDSFNELAGMLIDAKNH
ncbi:CvpA family protein [Marinibactrum halimedae]|uniref:CvpA family protein n=1 Tax=Marinibactrum halimedae TaxID=1444977 RepID=A0AA37T9P8_9GAMM|nr:CvpA family protein [Marinibactrum halimedae]MCD9457594.1 CvpA family protein [Marinibactrum halimedae]GLS28014.1 hypothetical protein GCM10007877_37330 [Marinibactrum halimedae]